MVQVCYRYSNQQSAMMKTDAGTCASLSVSLLTTSSRLSNHFLLYTPIDLRFRLYQQSNQTSHSHASFSSYPCLWFMALIYVTNLELSLYLQWHSDWKLCTWSVDWCHIQRPLMTPTQIMRRWISRKWRKIGPHFTTEYYPACRIVLFPMTLSDPTLFIIYGINICNQLRAVVPTASMATAEAVRYNAGS